MVGGGRFETIPRQRHRWAIPIPSIQVLLGRGIIHDGRDLTPGSRWQHIVRHMTALESEILEALVRLENVATGGTTGQPESVLPIVKRLSELTHALPLGTSPDLLHYLHKRSYEKARFWLQGRDAENSQGNCGHV